MGHRKPLRLLVVMPSWVGDVVMATPALRLLRDALPGAFIGALLRPGLDELLDGSGLVDEMHVDRARGVMGPKMVAAKIRPRQYDTALLLTNSFSTALVTRLAFIPRRIGYDRDGRGLLLTDRIKPERSTAGVMGAMGLGAFACVPAVQAYLKAARAVVGDVARDEGRTARAQSGGAVARLELGVTEAQAKLAAEVLAKARVKSGEKYVVLNPGANNPAKRWPAERFGAIARMCSEKYGVKVLVNGGPGEVEVVEAVVKSGRAGEGESGRVGVVGLTGLGMTMGALKAVVRGAGLMVTNDTGPRHIAAAMGVPVITLFGPTDRRWTTLPETGVPNVEIDADPTLPAEMVADEHPERCRIDRIEVERVWAAVERVLGRTAAS